MSTELSRVSPEVGEKVDFSLPTPWAERAKNIGSWLLHTAPFFSAFPALKAPLLLRGYFTYLAIDTLFSYIIQRRIMTELYPAQSRLKKSDPFPQFKTEALNQARQQVTAHLAKQGYVVREVVLEKHGVRYSGLLIGHQETIDNGNWVLQATGNGEPIEHSAALFAHIYHQYRFNTLLINGPSVGKSQGKATPTTIGDAQEVGLCFLETALKAQKLVIAGRSLGGAAIGQAILQHTFKQDVKYLVIRQMTFDRVSNICSKIVGQLFPRLEGVVASVIEWVGCEMDSVAASKKLQELGIQEVIIQASRQEIAPGQLPTAQDFQTDGVILAEASLGYALVKANITKNKVFHCLKNTGHMDDSTILAAGPQLEQFATYTIYQK
jgi:hypothetical protein